MIIHKRGMDMGGRRKSSIILPILLAVLFLLSEIVSVSAQIHSEAEPDTVVNVLSTAGAEPETESEPESAEVPDTGLTDETESIPEETADTGSDPVSEGIPEEGADGESDADNTEPDESSEVEPDPGQDTGAGAISGRVWEDTDKDGLMAPEESGIAGVRLFLISAENPAEWIEEVLTDENGGYAFDDIGPGEYRVSVEAQTVNGKQYSLPETQAQQGEDNQFSIDSESEPVRSYTDRIQIEEDGEVTKVNAGLYSETQVMPMSGPGIYDVYAGAVLKGSYDTLKEAVDACNTTEVFTIVLKENDTNMGDTAQINDNDRNITLTSSTGNRFTITQTENNRRHMIVFGGSDTSLTLENIILEGTGLAGGTDKNGGVQIGYSANLVMNAGSAIQKCYWDNGGGVYAQDGTVTISGGSLTENGAEYNGGAINGSSYAKITIHGGTIAYNRAAGEGGGIYLRDRQNVLTLNAGSIDHNQAHNGGGIYARESIVQLYGGSVVYNSAASDGGGLRTTDTDLTVNGADISHNNAAHGSGISANTENNSGNTVMLLAGTVTENISTQRGGGVNIDKNMTFEMYGGEISRNQASLGGGIIASVSSGIYVYEGLIAGNTATGDGGGILAEGGCLVTLDGANVSVTGNTANTGGGIHIQSGLVINHASISNNKAAVDGGGVYTSGIATISGAVFSNNEAKVDGGGIRGTGATVALDSTEISGNRAAHGAGISANGASEVTMSNGCAITGNIGGNRGGGVNIDDGTTFTMYDGTINGNQAETGGGVIVSLDSVFTMETGEINNNTAVLHGGGLRIQKARLFINGGTVQNNRTGSNGGGVYLWKSASFSMTGGTISLNKAEGDGGGIFTEDFVYENPLNSGYTNITMTGAAAVSGNTASENQTVPGLGSAVLGFPISLLDNDEINYYPQQVAVTYDPNVANGGDGIPVTKLYGSGSNVILESPSNLELDFKPAVAGTKFIHWNTEPNGQGTSYAGDGTGIYADLELPITFYAIWGLESGTISGTVFQDDDKSGEYEAGEGLDGRVVALYRKNSSGVYVDTNRTATTDADGRYQFTVDTNHSYKVVFKVVDGTVGEAGFIVKGSTDLSNHTNQDGFSDEIDVGYQAQAETVHIVNAGYAPPFPVVTGVYLDMMPWMLLIVSSNIMILGAFTVNRCIRMKKRKYAAKRFIPRHRI